MKRVALLFLVLLTSYFYAFSQLPHNRLYVFLREYGDMCYINLSNDMDYYLTAENDSVYSMGMAFNVADSELYAVDAYGVIYQISPTNYWSQVADFGSSITGETYGFTIDNNGFAYILTYDGAFGEYHIYQVSSDFSSVSDLGTFSGPYTFYGMVVDEEGDFLLVGDQYGGDGAICKVDLDNASIEELFVSYEIRNVTDATIDYNTGIIFTVDSYGYVYSINLQDSTANYYMNLYSSSSYNAIAVTPVDLDQLNIYVSDNQSNPIQDVNVGFQGSWYSKHFLTDADGYLNAQIPRGEYSLTLQKDGYLPVNTTIGFFEPMTLYFTMIREFTVAFHLIDQDNNPIPNQEIEIYSDTYYNSDYTDGSGDISFVVPQGVYEVEITNSLYHSVDTQFIINSDTAFTIVMQRYPWLTATVSDQDDNPLENVFVVPRFEDDYYWYYGYYTDVYGQVVVPLLPNTKSVEFFKYGYGFKYVDIPQIVDTTVSVTMSPGIRLQVNTTNDQGWSVYSRAYIDDNHYLSGASNHLWFLDPGNYTVHIEAGGYVPVDLDVNLTQPTVYNIVLQKGTYIELYSYYTGSNDFARAYETKFYIDGQYKGTGWYYRTVVVPGTHTFAAVNELDSLTEAMDLIEDYEVLTFNFLYTQDCWFKLVDLNDNPLPGASLYLDGMDSLDYYLTADQNGIITANIPFGNYIYTAQYKGVYTVSTVDLAFGMLDTVIIRIPYEQTLVQEPENSEFAITPNPVHNYTYLISPAGSLVEIYSMSGQKLIQLTTTTDRQYVNLSQLSAGVYIVKFRAKDQVKTLRLIKK